MENNLARITSFRFQSLNPLIWIFLVIYLLLLSFFNTFDVYHHYFFSTGPIIIAYNILRIFFILYLMWLCYAVGDFILICISRKACLLTLETILLAFFVGVSVWHIVLLCFGFASLYQRSIMAAITIILLTGSLPKLDKFIQYASTTLQKQSVYWPGLLLVMLSVTLFLISKGLYPAGGHDYYTHYFYYYKEVIESGSILPGRIWYHFYYDKGMGLFFLSMLLTDPLAPQLVTTAMIFAAAAIIFSLVRQATSWRLLPWVGVAFYMIFLIYTPGPPEAVRETGWFDLEKSHEPAALLMFAIIWITICLAKTNERRTWGLALILCMSALAIMSSAMAVFAIIYL